MRKILITGVAIVFAAALGAGGLANAQEQQSSLPQQRPALPPNNPFLIQNSVYPSVHFDSAQTDTTTLPVWDGSSTIEPSQVQWLPGLTTIGTSYRPYPGGESAIVFSGGNRVGKIRITDGDFSMIDEVSIPGLEDDTISTTQLRRIVKQWTPNGRRVYRVRSCE